MQTIHAMQGFPDGTPIDSVQVKIAKVFDRTPTSGGAYGPSSVQNAFISDATGAEMKLKVWGHPDIAKLEGQEVVIHASKTGKGLNVSHDTYKGKTSIILEASKAAQFQLVAVYHANNPSKTPDQAQGVSALAPDRQNPVIAKETASPGVPKIHGAVAGVAVNKSIDLLLKSDLALQLMRDGKLEEAIVSAGSQIVRAYLRLESGEGSLMPVVKPTKTEAPKDEDVPW